jgi:hypothetical protein
MFFQPCFYAKLYSYLRWPLVVYLQDILKIIISEPDIQTLASKNCKHSNVPSGLIVESITILIYRSLMKEIKFFAFTV